MKIQPHKVFQILTIVCLAIVVTISVLYVSEIVDDKSFAIWSGIVAILAGVFGIFASKPVSKEDVSVAMDKVLLTYDTETLLSLKKAKEEESEILDFIENRSNEIFLLKLREYLLDVIEKRYLNSEIAGLVDELEQVEKRLDKLNIQYGPLDLPSRFKRLLRDLNMRQQKELYLDLMNAMVDSIPFFPFKSMMKAMFRIQVLYRGELNPKVLFGLDSYQSKDDNDK